MGLRSLFQQPSLKSNLAIVLSIAALSISALLWFPRPGTTATFTALPMSGGVGTSPSPRATACSGTKPVGDLGDLMEHRVGPDLTRISFALHHDPRPLPERLENIAEVTSHLLGCVHEVPSFRPEVGLDRMAEYFAILGQMQANTLALQNASLEGDEATAAHWFIHLKQDCILCHSRFRPNGSE